MDHGLLLTKRPTDATFSAIGSASNDVTIGNYKGVMLCNRPFAGVSAAAKKQKKSNGASNHEGSFICGTVAKPWGGNVAIAEKSRVLSRLSKKDGALSKHKKWLRDLQQEREQQEKDRLEEAKTKEEQKRDFMDRQAKKRTSALEANKETRVSFDLEDDRDEQNCRKENIPPIKDEMDIRAKPAWALTETLAQEKVEFENCKEEEDLISFVDGLDFDQYSHDLELKVLMSQVKDRIKVLQKEKNIDEARLQAVMDSEAAAIRAEKYGSIAGSDMKIIGDGDGEDCDSDEDVKSIAESVRSEGSIRSVHSQRSMEALVSRSRERISSVLDPVQEGEVTMRPPVQITHTDDDGARMAETKSLSKLPFKNRNPAL